MKIGRIILTVVFGLMSLMPTMGGTPIEFIDDAYYWPGSSINQSANTAADPAEQNPEDVPTVNEPIEEQPIYEQYSEEQPVQQQPVVTFTNVQDTVVTAVIKR